MEKHLTAYHKSGHYVNNHFCHDSLITLHLLSGSLIIRNVFESLIARSPLIFSLITIFATHWPLTYPTCEEQEAFYCLFSFVPTYLCKNKIVSNEKNLENLLAGPFYFYKLEKYCETRLIHKYY